MLEFRVRNEKGLEFRVRNEKGVVTSYYADYVKLEAGALVFRNAPTAHHYPELVAVVANGFWRDVKVKK